MICNHNVKSEFAVNLEKTSVDFSADFATKIIIFNQICNLFAIFQYVFKFSELQLSEVYSHAWSDMQINLQKISISNKLQI